MKNVHCMTYRSGSKEEMLPKDVYKRQTFTNRSSDVGWSALLPIVSVVSFESPDGLSCVLPPPQAVSVTAIAIETMSAALLFFILLPPS